MIQALRQRHSRLAGHLAVLWLVLFLGCSLVHVDSHPHLDGQLGEESASVLGLEEAATFLQTTHGHGAAEAGALDDSCSALQNILFSQLLSLLALAALIAMPGLLALPDRLRGRLLRLVPCAHAPGFPPPLHLQLQRFNE